MSSNRIQLINSLAEVREGQELINSLFVQVIENLALGTPEGQAEVRRLSVILLRVIGIQPEKLLQVLRFVEVPH